ncbi:MAG: hypothetical protein ACYTAF_00860 [Planctomycetota bacterium]|jgi:predicted GNAT superfamily acetyltransferase
MGFLVIRPLRTAKELVEAENLQRSIWRFPEREIIPLNELAALRKHGAFVFGGFEKGRMVSFCYGQPAFRDGKVYHYSRILGVKPAYQGRGIARRMKLRQRDHVLDQGLDLVRWTFDPLQGPNASLNIAKLGCVVREYAADIYPGSGSRFNRGIGSDRFVTEWWVRSRHVRGVLSGKGKRCPPGEHEPAVETRVNRPVARKVKGKHVSVEIPDDIEKLKRRDPRLARRWRNATRGAFTELFGRGYVVHGFVRPTLEGIRRGVYLLEKGMRLP